MASGRYRKTYGAVLVLEAMTGPRPEAMECLHKDGNCLNDAHDNLRWGTSSENTQDTWRHGTMYAGDRHHRSVIPVADRPKIVSRRLRGESLSSIASSYGVTPTRISQLCKGA